MLERFGARRREWIEPVAAAREMVGHEAHILVSVGEYTDVTELERLGTELSARRVYYSESDRAASPDAAGAPIGISGLDESNKMSEGYGPCTGIVAIGTTTEGKVISLLTHQMPTMTSDPAYQKQLSTALHELAERAVPGTLDVIIFGGNVFEKKHLFTAPTVQEEPYLRAAEALTSIVEKETGVEPRLFGPNNGGVTGVVVDTPHRRVHMRRGQDDAFRSDFDRPASDALERGN